MHYLEGRLIKCNESIDAGAGGVRSWPNSQFFNKNGLFGQEYHILDESWSQIVLYSQVK